MNQTAAATLVSVLWLIFVFATAGFALAVVANLRIKKDGTGVRLYDPH